MSACKLTGVVIALHRQRSIQQDYDTIFGRSDTSASEPRGKFKISRHCNHIDKIKPTMIVEMLIDVQPVERVLGVGHPYSDQCYAGAEEG